MSKEISSANKIDSFDALPRERVTLFSVKELLFKYLSYLPFILLIFSITVGVGYLYIRYTEPIFKASIQILVKSDESKNAVAGQVELFQNPTRAQLINLDNEILKVRSVSLLKRVVEEGGFNIKVRNIGRFRSTTLYYDSPIKFDVVAVQDSSVSFELRFSSFDSLYAYMDKSILSEGLPSKIAFDKVVSYKGVDFIIKKRISFTSFNEPIAFLYSTTLQTARAILSNLSVIPVGKTSVLQLELKDDNPIRAKEILNKLAHVFREQDIENKRLSNINTSLFINERLKEVAKDLDSTEAKIMSLRKETKLNDIETTFGYLKDKLKNGELDIDKVNLQNELVNMLEDYFSKTKESGRIVPVDMGIDNTLLSNYLKQYNDFQLEYERQRKLLASDNDRFIIDIKTRIDGIRYNILEILNRIKIDNNKKLDAYRRKLGDYNKELMVLPDVERKYKIAQAQSTIKKELYLYLLKRKEETEISSATYVSTYDIIDDASASFYPVEPKANNIRNFSVLIGIVIPIVLIYLMELFNDKVTVRDQITKRLKLPIAGEVSHVTNPAKFVFNQSRSLVAEQFRILRTNLSYLFEGDPDRKVILISSTISGEGKSFVSSNLAAALAMMDKKVALLLFDLRKASTPPVLEELIQGKAGRGITNYLIGQTDDFMSLAISDEKYPSLDIYASGPIPPNPAELLLSSKMQTLFDQVRQKYDYIIVDSAPAGLVSDAFILRQYVDITLYIVRQQYTLLKQLDFIAEIHESEKLNHISLVVNDVIMGGRYGYYGYNYGYGYAYSYQYGYGYKYTKNTGSYYTDSAEDMYRPWWVKLIRLFSDKKRK